jgi:hypothetical protein
VIQTIQQLAQPETNTSLQEVLAPLSPQKPSLIFYKSLSISSHNRCEIKPNKWFQSENQANAQLDN